MKRPDRNTTAILQPAMTQTRGFVLRPVPLALAAAMALTTVSVNVPAADVEIWGPPGGGFAVRDSTGAILRLLVDVNGDVFIPHLPATIVQNSFLCFNATSGFGHLDLSTNAYSNIVNHASFELPSMNRITSSDTAHSYLLHKINGTHTGLAGCPVITPCFGGTAVACGGRMPCGGTLGTPDVTTITNWITGGALP